VQRQLEHDVDLARRHPPALPGRDQSDERVDQVVGRERRDRRQLAERHDELARQADLLLGLAQRRLAQIGVLGVTAPTREGDLARVPAQVGATSREHHRRRL